MSGLPSTALFSTDRLLQPLDLVSMLSQLGAVVCFAVLYRHDGTERRAPGRPAPVAGGVTAGFCGGGREWEVVSETYRTVAGRGAAEFEVKGSRFLGHVAPADTVEEAEAFVAAVGEEYDDATHNVPAYRVPAGSPSSSRPGGEAMLREWASDDGEPTGSAGKPALNVLVQQDLRNVVAVVTRYYGGVNLGVGGLARAYSRGVKEAVDDAGVVEERPHERVHVSVEYDDSGTVRGLLESAGVEFEATYEERVDFEARVAVEDAEALRDRIRSATSGRADVD